MNMTKLEQGMIDELRALFANNPHAQVYRQAIEQGAWVYVADYLERVGAHIEQGAFKARLIALVGTLRKSN